MCIHQLELQVYMHIAYIYVYSHIHTYIYRERERENRDMIGVELPQASTASLDSRTGLEATGTFTSSVTFRV